MNVSDKPNTLRAQMKHHEPIVCYAIEGNVVDRKSSKNGKGYCEAVSPTLNTQDRHAVCYSIDCRNLYTNRELSGTIQAKNEGGHSLNFVNPVMYEAKDG